MDILGLISSVSRIAIGAFVITLVVVGYEVFALMRKRKNAAPVAKKEVKVPEFKEAAQTGDFTPVDVGEEAMKPVETQTRKLSKRFLPILLVLFVLIVLLVGYFIYRRNQVSSLEVDVNEVSPVGETAQEITPEPTNPLGEAEPGEGSSAGGQGGLGTTPTPTLFPGSGVNPTDPPVTGTSESVSPTATPALTSSIQTPTDAPSASTGSATLSPTPTTSSGTIVSGEATSTPVPTTLPQAGTYQTTLLIAIVAIAVIYLALIL